MVDDGTNFQTRLNSALEHVHDLDFLSNLFTTVNLKFFKSVKFSLTSRERKKLMIQPIECRR